MLMQISEESIYKQPDSTLMYSEQLLALGKKTGDEKAIAAAYLVFGRHYSRSQEFEQSLLYLDKAANLFTKLNLPDELLKIQRTRADNEMRQGNFGKAMEILQSNIDESKKLKNLTEEALSTAAIGNIFTLNQQHEEAERQFLRALSIIRKTSSEREESLILFNLASCYFNWMKDEEGKKYLDTFFVIQQGLNDAALIASAKVNMANYYIFKERFDMAIKEYDDALVYFEKINAVPKIAFTLKRRADLYMMIGEYKKAIEDVSRCIALLEQKSEMDIHISDYYHIMYQANKKLGNHRKALEAFETAYDYKSKAISLETNRSLLELKEKYETEKKEEQIKLLEEQNKTKDALLKARAYFAIALAFLVIFSIAGAVLIRRQQRLKLQKKASELEHQVLRAQMNPHFIFNALNSIQRVYVEGDTNKANDFMADFAQLMRKVLTHNESTKIPVQEEIDTLRLYMDLEKLRSKDRFDYSIFIDEAISPLDTQIPPLIIQPFVENAIWHGLLPLTDRKGSITISLKANRGNTILVSIADNGVGFDDSENNKKHVSKGIGITEQRIGGKVTVKSEKGKGTVITFILKTVS